MPNETSSGGKDIVVGEFKSLEITGLTEPSGSDGEKAITAEYTIYYELTPFSALYNSDLSKGLQATSRFVLYDDGWRIAE